MQDTGSSKKLTPPPSSGELADLSALQPLEAVGSSLNWEQQRSSDRLAAVSPADYPTKISPTQDAPEGPPLHPIERAKLLRGESLDHFVLEDFVGIGGMGIVFRAKDTLLNRPVAIKALAGEQARDPETRKRFRNEAQSSARLDHENIARVFYIGEARGLPYIVFEFIDGVNVRDMVSRRGPLPLPEAISYTLQIAGALAHASSRDVVHRDVKPSNILITPDGRAKLVDMGLARLSLSDKSGSDLTASGVTLGTFDYISPEQARDPRTVDVRSDLYSLGCTLFFMLVGRPPFPEGTVLQKLLQHQAEAPPDPREFNPDTPVEVSRIVRKMMAKDPPRRYQTPSELITDLMLVAGDLGLRTAGSGGLVWVAPETLRTSFWDRHLPWLAPVAALCLAVAVMQWWAPDPLVDHPPWEPAQSVGLARVGAGATSGDHLQASPRQTVGEGNPRASVANGGDSRGNEPENSSSSVGKKSNSETTATTRDKGGVQVAGVNKSSTPTRTGSGDSGASKSLNSSASNSPRPAAANGYWLLGREGGRLFSSLTAALAASSEDYAEIELRFDGRRIEKPLVIEKNVTLRSAVGRRPILAFEHDAGRGLEPTTHMVTLASGSLTMIGLGLELEIPGELTQDRWSLFRTRGGRGLFLRDTSLTVQNVSGHLGVAFIDLSTTPGADTMMPSKMQTPTEPVQVEFLQVLARGDATLLRSHELQTVDFSATDSFIALGKPFSLLQARGGQMPPRSEGRSRLALDRVTALLRGGMLRLDSESGFAPLTPEVTCRQSILIGEASSDRDALRDDFSPLIEQVGAESPSVARQRDRYLIWNGEHVAYARIDSYWRVSPTSADPEDMSFHAWQEHWTFAENSPRQLRDSDWRRPLPKNELPVTSLSPLSFQLVEGANYGVDPSRLPTPPDIP